MLSKARLLLAISSVYLFPGVAGGQQLNLPRCESVEIESAARLDPGQESGIFGNGGDALTRKDGNGQRVSAVLLDFYEGLTTRPEMPPRLGNANLSIAEKVKLAISRLDRLDALRAAKYRLWLETFVAESCFASNITLRDIDDSQHYHLPAGDGWAIEQVAIHEEPALPEEPRYRINKDIWDLLDADNKAGLILHELVYREAFGDGIKSSRLVRGQVRFIASGAIEDIGRRGYIDRLKAIGFSAVSYGGVWLKTSEDISFDSDDPEQIKSASAVAGTHVIQPWGDLKIRCRVQFAQGQLAHMFYLAKQEFGDQPILTIGGRKLPLATQSQSEDCNVLPRNPLIWEGGYEWEVYFQHPEDPEVGTTGVTGNFREDVDAQGWSYGIGLAYGFMDGELTDALSIDSIERSWIVVNGVRCPIDKGPILYNGFPNPYSMQLGSCDIQIAASIVKIKGFAVFARADLGVKAKIVSLEFPQRLLVHPRHENQAVFTGEVGLHPDGSVAEGKIEQTARLQTADGRWLSFSAGHRVDFDENGYVIDDTN